MGEKATYSKRGHKVAPTEEEFVPKKAGHSEIAKLRTPDMPEGENAKLLRIGIEIMNIPAVNLFDLADVVEKVNQYFEVYAKYDVKPTVAGLGMVLGLERNRLLEIVNGTDCVAMSEDVRGFVKKAYRQLALLWEAYMQGGKINPVSGIFLGKNNFGYADKTEYVVTPNRQVEDYSADDIKKRYATLDSAELPTLDSADSEYDSD